MILTLSLVNPLPRHLDSSTLTVSLANAVSLVSSVPPSPLLATSAITPKLLLSCSTLTMATSSSSTCTKYLTATFSLSRSESHWF